MKNQIKPIITTLLLSVATFANAKTSPNTITIKPFATGIYKTFGEPILYVNIDKMKGTKVIITLKDVDGEVVFMDVMRKSVTFYRTKIDMYQLEMGEYTLEINDGVNKELKKIEI